MNTVTRRALKPQLLGMLFGILICAAVWFGNHYNAQAGTALWSLHQALFILAAIIGFTTYPRRFRAWIFCLAFTATSFAIVVGERLLLG